MIGYRFKNGAQVVLMAPSEHTDAYVILARYGNQLVTAHVHVNALPAPEEWWAGEYFTDAERDEKAAIESFVRRSLMESAGPYCIGGHGETDDKGCMVWTSGAYPTLLQLYRATIKSLDEVSA